MEHVFDGRELELIYAKETIKHLQKLWGHKITLITKTKDEKEFLINCDDTGKITVNDGNKTTAS